MKLSCIRASELDAPLVARWHALCAADSGLASPYFCVEYTQAVARVRDDVFVGVLEDGAAVQGFFPFQRESPTIAGPVGGRLSDCHGVIAARELAWDAAQLMRACGLNIWDFDHVPASQQAFEPHARLRSESPIVELDGGFQAYLARRKAAGAQRLAQIQRKERKFEREVGPLRFEADCRDPRAFAQVLHWKREQCLRTGVPDFLSWGWTTAMLEQIWSVATPGFAGQLSVLWHDDTILAAHFGMRSAAVWHWWFPTYNAAYSQHSPGAILLLKTAELAAGAGARYLDLGKGEDAYKASFATGAIPLLEGSVLMPSWASSWRRMRSSSLAFLRHSAALQPARTGWRQVRNWLSQRTATSAAPIH